MKKFDKKIRVYYEDTDAGGIVYYANYLKYFERARSDWVRQLGADQVNLLEQSIAFVVKELNIVYHKSAVLDDVLTVSCEPTIIKRVSIMFNQAVYNNKKECLVEAKVKVGCVDTRKKTPCPIPSNLLREMRSDK
ncbi:tol-pal system-associated acyl-CoA thioesterase [Glaciecola sp. XM2]|jgi:acyl-CoA thioester hydrolase|uniref:tol-pal system-associated acyl-CoA thioesterase n=1 Tax=Glaciecola sp. XM2 TaxID=1914931 RepID=UPI001BDF56FB|nr:tol-pal system-associated acyl-CoA thioesterase [Glaciecola sp. XM2]MBT1450027.1 tol-pal system-associated acyl-CoA thioesterase [Glaciecola sp. XM2]